MSSPGTGTSPGRGVKRKKEDELADLMNAWTPSSSTPTSSKVWVLWNIQQFKTPEDLLFFRNCCVELFGKFGSIKDFYLPDLKHRDADWFCFVEFETAFEAERCVKLLSKEQKENSVKQILPSISNEMKVYCVEIVTNMKSVFLADARGLLYADRGKRVKHNEDVAHDLEGFVSIADISHAENHGLTSISNFSVPSST